MKCSKCGKSVTSSRIICDVCAEDVIKIPCRIGRTIIFRNPVGVLSNLVCVSEKEAAIYFSAIKRETVLRNAGISTDAAKALEGLK